MLESADSIDSWQLANLIKTYTSPLNIVPIWVFKCELKINLNLVASLEGMASSKGLFVSRARIP